MSNGKRKPVKLPARVLRIIARIEAGEKLCIYQHRKTSGETEDRFFFEPGGGQLPRKVSPSGHQVWKAEAWRRRTFRTRNLADVG